MSDVLSKLIGVVKKNKILVSILVLFLFVLIYCHFNTFLGNDDLPYSFFKRLHQRVTNPFQIIWDNLRYYKSTNGRFIIHCIVMSLLVFGKSLWSILNPLVIVFSIIILYKFAFYNKKTDNNFVKIIVILSLSSLFLSMYGFKELIYWVAGSVNYLWVCFFILVYLYLYLFKSIFKSKKTNMILLFVLSTLHENSFVFFIIFIVVINIIEYIKVKKLTYWELIIPVILGGMVLLLAPGNISRTNNNELWNSMTLFERLNISIPYVSKSVFCLMNFTCLIPTIYIFVIIVKLVIIRKKSIIEIVLSSTALILTITSYYNLNYSYFLLAIVLLLSELYIHVVEKNHYLIPIELGFYAISFSMVMTPLYNSTRPNLLLYMYFSLIIVRFAIDFMKKKLIRVLLLVITISSFIVLNLKEIDIYYNIGTIHRDRLETMREFKKNPQNLLILKKIPDKYSKYHQDCNVVDQDFWTYNWFIWYYDLPDNTKIIYKP